MNTVYIFFRIYVCIIKSFKLPMNIAGKTNCFALQQRLEVKNNQ